MKNSNNMDINNELARTRTNSDREFVSVRTGSLFRIMFGTKIWTNSTG